MELLSSEVLIIVGDHNGNLKRDSHKNEEIMGNKELEFSMKKKTPYNLKNQDYLIDSMIIMTKDVLFLLDGQTYNYHATIR